MKKTLTVFFVLGLVIASTQSFRHIYVKWFAPTDSVLDQFRDDFETDAMTAESLDELVQLYIVSEDKIEAYEAEESNPEIEFYNQRNVEPYKSRDVVRAQIQERENWNRKLHELKIYWFFGVMTAVLGCVLAFIYKNWIGVSLLITGFSEMLFWTSPLTHMRSISLQFESLLNYKLAFSILTWIFMLSLWIYYTNSSNGERGSGVKVG
ncbi:MAG: hypothetical protein AAGH40_06370 [Verrucomicrobiota bacterium]